jgi:hypothetical protein
MIKIVKSKFLAALNRISTAIAKKDLVEDLQYVVVEDGVLYTYNNKYIGSSSIEELKDVSFVVKGNDLLDLLKKIKTKDILLEVEEKILVVVGGKTEVEVPLLESDTVLKAHDSIRHSASEPRELNTQGFCEALSLAKTACSKNLNSIKGLHAVKVTEEYLFATDNMRCCIADHGSTIPEDFFLPAEAINAVVGVSPTKISFSSNGIWVLFHNDKGDMFGCKTLELFDIFPPEEGFFKYFDAKALISFTFPENLMEEIKVLDLFDSDGTLRIEISEKGDLSISTDSVKGAAFLTEKVKNYKGEQVSFQLKVQLIEEILSKSLTVSLTQNFLFIEDEYFRYLAAFVR